MRNCAQALAHAVETMARETKRAGARKVMIEKRKEDAERRAAMQERREEEDRLLQARLADAAEEERRRQERCSCRRLLVAAPQYVCSSRRGALQGGRDCICQAHLSGACRCGSGSGAHMVCYRASLGLRKPGTPHVFPMPELMSAGPIRCA